MHPHPQHAEADATAYFTHPASTAHLFPVEKDGVEAAIDAFLEQHGGPALREPAIVEYMQGLLADRDAENEAGTIEQLDDVLCGFDADCWAALRESVRHQALCGLLAEIGTLLRELEPDPGAAAQPPEETTLLIDNDAACGTAADCRSSDAPRIAAAADSADSAAGADPAAVATLRDLCCDEASPEFLAHVLMRRCHGDIEAAAQQLIDWHGELPRQEASWRKSQAEADAASARDAAAAAAERRRVCARFDLQAVPEGSSGGRRSKKGQVEVDAWQPADGTKRNVRYRDGRLVTTRGEKYILESLREDYDGGSRGKVKTKGKRGVGFV